MSPKREGEKGSERENERGEDRNTRRAEEDEGWCRRRGVVSVVPAGSSRWTFV